MHKTIGEAETFARELLAGLPVSLNREIAIAPPFTALFQVGILLKDSSVSLAAQNAHDQPHGAYTGEVSPPMLADVGCRYVIVGHSERRLHFGETDTWINLKLRAILAYGMSPILCVGETLVERERDETFTVINRQINIALGNLSQADMRRVVIAYEPVWAIGTGKTAKPNQAQAVHLYIRHEIGRLFSPDTAAYARILYGGSVNASNISALMKEADIDGVLVGGASLNVDDFLSIILYNN